MEEHVVVENLRESRERLRMLLVLGTGSPRPPDEDTFPRSSVMRFLLDPRRRKVALAVLSAFWMVAGRRQVAAAGALGTLTRTMGTLAGMARRRLS